MTLDLLTKVQCHSHPKVKDAPKRRRESNNTRAVGGGVPMTRPKIEPQPTTPQAKATAASAGTTPTPRPISASISHERMVLPEQPQPQKTFPPLEGLTNMI